VLEIVDDTVFPAPFEQLHGLPPGARATLHPVAAVDVPTAG